MSQEGLVEGAQKGVDAVNEANKMIDGGIATLNEMGADAVVQGEKARGRWKAATGKIIALQAAAKGEMQNNIQKAQAQMAENAAAKAGKSAADLFTEIVPNPNPIHLGQKGIEKLIDTGSKIAEGAEDQKQKYNAGVQKGIQDYNNSKTPEAPTDSPSNEGGDGQGGGRRRRRRRRTRRKKRRKSRKSRRRRRRSRKKKRRRSRKRRGGKSRKKTRRRRRR